MFYPNSNVPQNERFKDKQECCPGPGRYYPQGIACPCACGTAYSQLITRKLQKSNAERRTKKKISIKKCDEPLIRQIAGFGHTSVFCSKTKRLLERSIGKVKNSTSVNLQMEHTNQYIFRIMNPLRKPLSLPIVDFNLERQKMRYCCLERPMKRFQLRQNKKIAFLSCSHRFPEKTSLNFESSLIKPMKKLAAPVPVDRIPNEIHLMKAKDRLKIWPKRYVENLPIKNVLHVMNSVYQPLPSPRLLLPEFLYKETRSMETISRPIKIEHVFKDEYQKYLA